MCPHSLSLSYGVEPEGELRAVMLEGHSAKLHWHQSGYGTGTRQAGDRKCGAGSRAGAQGRDLEE